MLRIVLYGPTKVGKSALVNALVGAEVAATSLLGNKTTAPAKYEFTSDDGIKCAIWDTPARFGINPADYDLALYLADVNVGIDDANWRAFYDRIKDIKAMQCVIVVTKCDAPIYTVLAPSDIKSGPAFLIAEDEATQIGEFASNEIAEVFGVLLAKYGDVCPVLPFNALGRLKSPRALTQNNIALNFSRYWQYKNTKAKFGEIQKLFDTAKTLPDTVKKYSEKYSQCACVVCRRIAPYNSGDYDRYMREMSKYILKKQFKLTVGEHNYIGNAGTNGGIEKSCLYCHHFIDVYGRSGNCVSQCDLKRTCCSCSSKCNQKYFFENYKHQCAYGMHPCAFHEDNPAAKFAAQLQAAFDAEPDEDIKFAIVEFAQTGKSHFGPSPAFSEELWNIMSLRLNFGADYMRRVLPKLAPKVGTQRLLQFARDLSIVEKINIYVRGGGEHRITCGNGESRVLLFAPIFDIADLEVAFTFNETLRPAGQTSFARFKYDSTGRTPHDAVGQKYGAEVRAQLVAIVGRINVAPADYDKLGLFN